jgi:hypothetical protein
MADERAHGMTPAVPEESWIRRYRRFAMGVIYATVLLAALTNRHGDSSRILTALVGASAITLACMLDARIHGRFFLRSYAFALFVTWPVGTLVHLIWTRGARGVAVYFMLVAAFVGVWIIGLAIGAVLAGL